MQSVLDQLGRTPDHNKVGWSCRLSLLAIVLPLLIKPASIPAFLVILEFFLLSSVQNVSFWKT